MKYLVKVFRLSIRVATIKGKRTIVRRWVRNKILECEYANKKEALQLISSYVNIDKKDNCCFTYKYTLQCIGGKKRG